MIGATVMASEGYKYFLNRSDSASGFSDSINGNIFVDKSMLLNFTEAEFLQKKSGSVSVVHAVLEKR